MASPTATVNPAELRSLDATILRVAKATQRSVGDVVIQATVFAAQSAGKVTPLAKKNRRYRTVGKAWGEISAKARAKRDAKGIPWWARWSVRIWKRGIAGDVFVRTQQRLDKLRPTPRRGAARNSWTRALAMIGSRSTGYAPAAGSNLSVRRSGGSVIATRYTNFIKYLSQIAPNSAEVGMAKARGRMAKFYLPKVKRAAAAAMRSK